MVGETADGDPIVEVRSVRLVLQGEANHFNRMLSCSRCGRDSPGRKVLGPADLNQRVDTVVCKDCVRGATSTASSGSRPKIADSPTSNTAPSRVAELTALEPQTTDRTELSHGQRSEEGPSVEELSRSTEARLTGLASITTELSRKQEELGQAIASALDRVERAVDVGPAAGFDQRLEVALERRLAPLEAEHAQLQASLDARVKAIQLETAQMRAGVVRIEQQLAQGLAAAAEAEGARRRELEVRVEEAIEGRPSDGEAQQSELHAALESQVRRLSAELERYTEEARTDVAAVKVTSDEVRSAQEALSRRLEDIWERQLQAADAAQVGSDAAAPDRANVVAILEEQLHHRLASTAEAVEARAERIEAEQVKFRAALESSVDGLRTALEQQAEEARSAVAGVEAISDDVRRSQEALSRGLEGVLERVQRVEAAAEAAGARSESAARDQDWSARAAAEQAEFRASLESTVEHLGASVERQADHLRLEQEEVRREFESVRNQLQQLTADLHANRARAEAKSATTASQAPEVDEWELESMERDLKEEIGLLPGALESLRHELQTAFTDAMAVVQSSSAARAEEQTARMKALENAVAERSNDVSDLFDLQTALDAGLGRLASDLAAIRGISGGSALGPIRSDVHALQKQIAAQNRALAALKRSIEALRREGSSGSALAPKKKVSPKEK